MNNEEIQAEFNRLREVQVGLLCQNVILGATQRALKSFLLELYAQNAEFVPPLSSIEERIDARILEDLQSTLEGIEDKDPALAALLQKHVDDAQGFFLAIIPDFKLRHYRNFAIHDIREGGW